MIDLRSISEMENYKKVINADLEEAKRMKAMAMEVQDTEASINADEMLQRILLRQAEAEKWENENKINYQTQDFQYPSFTTKEQGEEFKKNLTNYLGFELPIRVVGDDILVLVQLSSKRLNSDGTESMIALPDSVVEVEAFKLKKGVVLDVGPEAYSNEGRVGVQYKAPWCKVGDIILFSTTPIYYKCNNKALAIMRAAEVRAVIKDIDCVDYYFKNI